MSSGTPMVRAADIRHDWFVVDAADQVLGRLASASRGPVGQAPRELRPVPGHRRLRGRHQRREGPADGAQARREDLPPAHRLPRRAEVGPRAGHAGQVPGAADRSRRARHAPASPSMGRKQLKKLKVYRGRDASARGAEAPAADAVRRTAATAKHGGILAVEISAQSHGTAEDVDGARPARSREPARSRSTSAPSTTTSPTTSSR